MASISCNFDSGAIEVLDASRVDDIRLRIRADSHADFTQWFHFRLSGAAGQDACMRLVNASACTYPDGWKDYRAVASYDRIDWFRVPATYEGGELVIRHRPEHDAVWYAYFEPYPLERHMALLGRAAGSPFARVERLGSTVEGRDLDMVVVGDAGKLPVWVIARQHPGESMAEWFVEGMLERLLDRQDPVSRRLLARATVYLVPNMNPDGSVRGNLRTNAAGANLNREWSAPDMARSPEVFLVRERMAATGAAMFMDVHGDESLPWVFVAGSEMLPTFTAAQAARQSAFIARYKQASPDFQDSHGYASGKYSSEALKLASKYVGHVHGCLSLTLEMPFKDNAGLPDERHGWNGERSRKLGAATLEPMLADLESCGASGN
jgi:murein tripeptide amidase MpaA